MRLLSDHRDNLVAGRTRLVNQLIVHQLTEQLLRLWEEIETVESALAARVRETETPLLGLCGIGVVAAVRLIGELGCTPRIRSAAALAALAGVAPVAVSSGGRNGHRLNRGGNGRLNRTFHMIAVCQLRCEPQARANYAKKLTEGKTARSALRCLKRRLVDVVYRLLREQERAPAPKAESGNALEASLQPAA